MTRKCQQTDICYSYIFSWSRQVVFFQGKTLKKLLLELKIKHFHGNMEVRENGKIKK